MKKLEMETDINASREKVWDSIVNKAKYEKWTAPFNESSTFEGGWNKGDRILFVAINDDGKKEGMVSEIAESSYPEFISIRHRGIILDGVEDTTSEEVKKWTPSLENYTLVLLDKDKTRFKVTLDTPDDYYDMFTDMWTKALKVLKEVSETR